MSGSERQKKLFDNIAEKYCSLRQDERCLLLKKAIWNHVNLEVKENAKVLDAMCGYCDAFEIVKSHAGGSFEYHACDISSNMIELAKRRYPKAKIWLQDITTFKSGEKYDLIFVIGGLHHVYKDVGSVVKSLADSLNDDGKIVIFEPTHNNIFQKKIREAIYKRNSLFDEQTERGFTTKELDQIFYKNGMKIREQIYPGLLAYILWYNPDAFPALNRGSLFFVKLILNMEKIFWKTAFAKFLSYATLSIYEKCKAV